MITVFIHEGESAHQVCAIYICNKQYKTLQTSCMKLLYKTNTHYFRTETATGVLLHTQCYMHNGRNTNFQKLPGAHEQLYCFTC